MKFVAVAVVALALPGPTVAQASAKAAKICRTTPNATGSRIPKRVCKTKEQWETLDGIQEIETQSKGGARLGPMNVEKDGPGSYLNPLDPYNPRS